ncbi:MAG TPA: carotenoid 1,2-hydratase, partial [Caldimonas sp.]
GSTGTSRYRARAASDSAGFAFDLVLTASQPLLLQGRAGISRKGPRSEQSSRYYSEPQLAADGAFTIDGKRVAVTGRAWLDHEWSDSFLDHEAVGWDWIGMNLADGAALTAFRLRRADGSALWSGGSIRPAGGATRDFASDEVVFVAGRTWTSAASGARYPVEWQVATPAGRFAVRALQDDQELDSRASTGAIYWEGLSLLLDGAGAPVGRGYLEMTGYAARLVL